MVTKEIISSIGLGLTIAVLYKGYLEYKKNQAWKKVEFIAKETKEFFNDTNVNRTFILLDWNNITIPIKENETSLGVKILRIDDKMLFKALRFHHPDGEFSEKEALIRHLFDDFFTKLGRFNQYVETKLVEEGDLKLYLIYWLQLITISNRKSQDVILRLWEFIRKYNYEDVEQLCIKFGFTIPKADPTN